MVFPGDLKLGGRIHRTRPLWSMRRYSFGVPGDEVFRRPTRAHLTGLAEADKSTQYGRNAPSIGQSCWGKAWAKLGQSLGKAWAELRQDLGGF
jgi:hypothetical protein